MSLKKYRLWDTDQVFLFPPAMRVWLDEDHLVYRLLDVIDALDIRSVTHSIHAKDARGTRLYNPRMMLALLFYSYSNGVYSSQRSRLSRSFDGATRARPSRGIPTTAALLAPTALSSGIRAANPRLGGRAALTLSETPPVPSQPS